MTAQFPERLIVRGQTLALYGTPLDRYLTRLPKSRRPQFVVECTALRRGYIGTWAIRDGALWLDAIEGTLWQNDTYVDASLEAVFPRAKGPVKATFVTEELRCPEGAQLAYEHHPFASPFERDRVFRIRRGEVEAERLYVNPPYWIGYDIKPDGTRAILSDGVLNGKDPVDLYAPDEIPRAPRFWRQAADYLETLPAEEPDPVHVGGFTIKR